MKRTAKLGALLVAAGAISGLASPALADPGTDLTGPHWQLVGPLSPQPDPLPQPDAGDPRPNIGTCYPNGSERHLQWQQFNWNNFGADMGHVRLTVAWSDDCYQILGDLGSGIGAVIQYDLTTLGQLYWDHKSTSVAVHEFHKYGSPYAYPHGSWSVKQTETFCHGKDSAGVDFRPYCYNPVDHGPDGQPGGGTKQITIGMTVYADGAPFAPDHLCWFRDERDFDFDSPDGRVSHNEGCAYIAN